MDFYSRVKEFSLFKKSSDDRLFMKLDAESENSTEGKLCLNDFWMFDSFSGENEEILHRIIVPLWLIKSTAVDDSRVQITEK